MASGIICAMKIPGWEDYPLVDGAQLMAEKAFWVAYLESAMGIEEIEPFEESFAIGPDAAGDCFERLCDPEEWPVFRVPLRTGAVLNVIHRNLEDEPGVEFVLTAGEPPASWTLATVEARFSGPGLSWRELIGAVDPVPAALAGAEAGAPPAGTLDPAGGPLGSAARLLLLLPAVGEADLPDDAVPTVARALDEVGAAAEATTESDARTERLARTLLYEREGLWEPAHWVHRSGGALCCDGGHSRRGTGPAAFSASDALAVTSALAIG